MMGIRRQDADKATAGSRRFADPSYCRLPAANR